MKRHFFVMKLLFDCICLKQDLPDYRSRQAGAQNDRMSRMVGGGGGGCLNQDFQDLRIFRIVSTGP